MPGPAAACGQALLVLASRIRIEDRLLLVLKGARHVPPEEMMTSVCNQTASQVFVDRRSIAIETACRPQALINNTKREIVMSYSGSVKIQTCYFLKHLDSTILRDAKDRNSFIVF